MRALVTGGTGFIGQRLLTKLDRPIILSRRPPAQTAPDGATYFAWDPETEPAPAAAFEGVDVVFHLAGEPVAGRWNREKKRRVLSSRREGTANLVRGMAALSERPSVLVSASAIGIYGSRGDEVLTESSDVSAGRVGDDFLAEVCRAWEEASAPAVDLGVRVVNPRIGIVLGPGGGALQQMLLPFKLGLGGRLASGRQWMSWVHVEDMVNLLLHSAAQKDLSGPVNGVAPQPLTNRDFTRQLGRALRRPAVLPSPALALRIVLGQFAEVLLASQRVLPKIAESSGFKFQFPRLDMALDDILNAPSAKAAS